MIGIEKVVGQDKINYIYLDNIYLDNQPHPLTKYLQHLSQKKSK